VLIDKNGSCYACECTSWLPQSIGNLHIQTLNQITQSNMSKTLQNSIADGSYRYCNNTQCSYLLDPRPNNWPNSIPEKYIKNIRLAIDDSCNLSCPSCRTQKIFLSKGQQLEQRISLAKKILNYISEQDYSIKIHLGSDGDPFASLVYRYFIRETRVLSNLSFSVQTNGLLIKKMYQRNEEFFKKLDVLNISIDGASKETYEKLRRGAIFEKIIENLEFVKEIKKKFNFEFIIHFVVQQENYHEMLDIIEIAKKYSADRVWLNKITNWNTFKNFEEKDITNPKNTKHYFFKEMLKKVKNKIAEKTDSFIEIPTLES
jgi:MoaA/NifB/PqqE/SkfB family radical SAM enzyme